MTAHPLDIDAIKARSTRAEAELTRMLDGGNPATAWRWSIPANPDRDTDLILADSVKDVPALVAEVERLRAELKKFRRGGVQLGYGFNHLSLTMRCAWIAEQEKPGTGMRWITNDLAEANAIPGQSMDYEPADDWDGKETAQEYHDRFHRDLYEEREANIAGIEAEQ